MLATSGRESFDVYPWIVDDSHQPGILQLNFHWSPPLDDDEDLDLDDDPRDATDAECVQVLDKWLAFHARAIRASADIPFDPRELMYEFPRGEFPCSCQKCIRGV